MFQDPQGGAESFIKILQAFRGGSLQSLVVGLMHVRVGLKDWLKAFKSLGMSFFRLFSWGLMYVSGATRWG